MSHRHPFSTSLDLLQKSDYRLDAAVLLRVLLNARKLWQQTLVISGCLASLWGAYFNLVQVRFFAEGMSAGKGFIAIAALIFGRWHPIGSALASLLFGATEALQLRIQALGANIPYQFLVMLPYAIASLLPKRKAHALAFGRSLYWH